MPRLFSGLEIPHGVASRLSMLREPLAGAKWVDVDDYHITLRFLGDVDGATARQFAAALDEIEAPPFEVALDGLGAFGGARPHAIYAAVKRSSALEQLQRAHERAARLAGLAPEGRNFTPHVTLARLRGVRDEAAARYLGRFGAFAAPPFRAERFVIFSAKESTGGGPYVVEESYALAAPPEPFGEI
jgi:2'-5' RNA ligase